MLELEMSSEIWKEGGVRSTSQLDDKMNSNKMKHAPKNMVLIYASRDNTKSKVFDNRLIRTSKYLELNFLELNFPRTV